MNDNVYGSAIHPPTWSLKSFQDQVLCEAARDAGCNMEDYKPGLDVLSCLLNEAYARYNAYRDGIAVGVDGMHADTPDDYRKLVADQEEARSSTLTGEFLARCAKLAEPEQPVQAPGTSEYSYQFCAYWLTPEQAAMLFQFIVNYAEERNIYVGGGFCTAAPV